MANKQLLEYIQQSLQQGVDQKGLKATLREKGWVLGDIEEALKQVSGNMLSTTIPTKPPIVLRFLKTVIAILWLLAGIGTVLSAAAVMVGSFREGDVSFMEIIMVLVVLVLGAGIFAMAWGMSKMRRWALYAHTTLFLAGILIALGFVFYVYGPQEVALAVIVISISNVVQIALLVYFWFQRKWWT